MSNYGRSGIMFGDTYLNISCLGSQQYVNRFSPILQLLPDMVLWNGYWSPGWLRWRRLHKTPETGPALDKFSDNLFIPEPSTRA